MKFRLSTQRTALRLYVVGEVKATECGIVAAHAAYHRGCSNDGPLKDEMEYRSSLFSDTELKASHHWLSVSTSQL